MTNRSTNPASLARSATVKDGNVAMPPSDISPDQIGAMVVNAIEADQLYIISHPQHWDGVERRIRDLSAAFGQSL